MDPGFYHFNPGRISGISNRIWHVVIAQKKPQWIDTCNSPKVLRDQRERLDSAPESTILTLCCRGGDVESKQWDTAKASPAGIAYVLGGLPTGQECGCSEARAHALPVCFMSPWAGKKLHISPPGPTHRERGRTGGVSVQPWPCCSQRK